uniref:Uncharacterized protein n=1 Tax=Glossina palpalis gambiensis TaxID=67801 RepID=A0A1B0ALT6_9MUSC
MTTDMHEACIRNSAKPKKFFIFAYCVDKLASNDVNESGDDMGRERKREYCGNIDVCGASGVLIDGCGLYAAASWYLWLPKNRGNNFSYLAPETLQYESLSHLPAN